MGKRKKTTTAPVEDIKQATEVKDTKVTSPSNASINKVGYQGTVWVTVKKNQQVISKRQYTNHGTSKLFHFLSTCLANWDSAPLRKEAPTYIQLFTTDDVSALEGSYIDENHSLINSGNKFIPCIPLTESTVDSTGVAHLNFLIPGQAISGISIYQAALYNQYWAEPSLVKLNFSAAFNFKDEITWQPILVYTDSADYTLYIDWTMSFDNK